MTETNILNRYQAMAHSQDADERAEAARDLKEFLRNDSACSILAELLGDSDWRVRRAAVESFLEMRAHNAIPQILQALYTEDNAGKRNAAIDILTRFGKEIIPYLEPHLNSDNPDVQMFLINILADLRDDTFLDFITQSLDHTDQNIVSAAILAIGRIGNPQSLPHLLRFLHGADMWLTFQAIEAAGEMQDPATIVDLIQLYQSHYYRKAVIRALSKFSHPDSYRALTRFLVTDGKLDPDALQALIDLYHAPMPAELRQEEQERLRTEFKTHIQKDILMQEFGAAAPTLKRNILESLGWSQSAAAVPILVSSLQTEELMETAAQALIDCSQEAMPSLVRRLKEDLEEEEIVLILNILNELSTVTDFHEIKNLLEHESGEIRHQSFRILARSTSPETTPYLLKGIMDTHSAINELCRDPLLARCRNSRTLQQEVKEKVQQKIQSESGTERANAIEFLILLQGEQSFPMLFQALKDEDATVRQKAVSLMGTGYHHEFQRPLSSALADEDARVRELAARGLAGYASPEVVDALLSSVRDEVIWVRLATYESLAAIGESRAATVLTQQIETENPIARATLLRCLKQFRSPASKDLLLKHLNSEDAELRKSACESLGAFSDNDIVFHLFTLLQNDPDWRVRVATIDALTDIKPFRLQQALLERLKQDSDPLVRRQILASLLKLGIDSVPDELYGFLLDRHLADSAYQFLNTIKSRFSKQIKEAYKNQPPAVRRILKTIVN